MKPRIKRNEWIAAGGVASGLAVLYCVFLPLKNTWANYGGDGGDFLAAILSGGVPHPSGYPTYVLLGRLFQLIPFGSPYWRGALLSAICMAAAAGLLAAWTATFAADSSQRPWLAGLIAGLMWGLAPLVWSQAVIVEVYGLQALFVVLWMWWAGLLAAGQYSGWVGVLAFAAGLSVGNHLTILLMLPVALLAMGMAVRRGASKRWLALQIGLPWLGLLVYFYLPLSARGYPPVNWGDPQTLAGFVWTVTGQPYRGLLFHTPPTDLLNRLSAWSRLVIEQFGVPGLILGAVGVVQTRLRRFPQALLLWMFFAYTIFAIGYKTSDSILYLIPALMAGAVWVSQGVNLVWEWGWRSIPAGKLLVLSLALVVFIRLPATARSVDPRQPEASAYVEAYLREAPTNAILMTLSDADSFPLWFAVYGLGERPDVVIVVKPLTVFSWYRQTLIHTYPNLTFPPLEKPAGGDWAEALVKLNPARPVCRSQASQELIPKVTYDCR